METLLPLEENEENEENEKNKENQNAFEKEHEILRHIKERFPAVDIENANIAKRRIYLSIDSADLTDSGIFLQALQFAAQELGFFRLCTITGIDNLDSFEFLYHIVNTDGILLTLKLKTPRNDNTVIASVLPIYNGATFYERELEGLLGIKVEGLTEGRQYPLPDNWPQNQYPLRKDWTPGQNTDTIQTAQKDNTKDNTDGRKDGVSKENE